MDNNYYKILEDMMLLIKQSNHRKEIMSVDDLHVYLGFSKSYIYKLTSEKLIPHYKPLNKSLFFKRSEIDAWILKCPVETRDVLLERALIPMKINIKNHSK